jgi:hypothetical protein
MDHVVIESALAELDPADSRELERYCDRYAREFLAAGVEPQFHVATADFARDPYLICADRYWNYRHRDEPTLHTAVACAGWLAEHVALDVRTAVREKWAVGYAFITRDSVQSLADIADATADIIASDDSDCSRAYFATLYHAGKLRANFAFSELGLFLESSPLALAAGNNRETPLFTAFLALAAYGSRKSNPTYAGELLDRAWNAPDRTHATVDTALNALATAVPFDGQGELLRDRSGEALAGYPGNHLFHFRLAQALHMSGDYDAALPEIDAALERLPATGWRIQHELFQIQFTALRDAIRHSQAQARDFAAQAERLDRQRQEVETIADAVQKQTTQVIVAVALSVAVIAFAWGALNITLTGLGLGARFALLGGFFAGMTAYAVLVVAGVWFLTARRRRR